MLDFYTNEQFKYPTIMLFHRNYYYPSYILYPYNCQVTYGYRKLCDINSLLGEWNSGTLHSTVYVSQLAPIHNIHSCWLSSRVCYHTLQLFHIVVGKETFFPADLTHPPTRCIWKETENGNHEIIIQIWQIKFISLISLLFYATLIFPLALTFSTFTPSLSLSLSISLKQSLIFFIWTNLPSVVSIAIYVHCTCHMTILAVREGTEGFGGIILGGNGAGVCVCVAVCLLW